MPEVIRASFLLFQSQIVRKTIYFPTEMYYNGLVKWGNIVSEQYLFSFAKGIVMLKLLAVFAASLVLAYISEQNTKAAIASGQRYVAHKDWAYVLLVTILVLFAGLRTSYNDTQNYIRIFRESPGLAGFFSNPDNLNPLSNPLFYTILNIIKDLTNNAQLLIFLTSFLAQICFIRFIKHYSSNFVFGIFIYFTLGTFALSMAAIKQITAMAILTLAMPFLERKKWMPYYSLVLIAMLVHTYAIAFVVLPLFVRRPWRLFTFVFAFATVVLLLNFQSAITTFLEQADEVGKTIADYEVFDDNTVNVFRIAVYAVPPLFSLVFQKWVFHDSSPTKHVLVHMSIISLAFMILGTQSGANMFGRMAYYFELGAICCLPWMLERTFEERSHGFVSTMAAICFLGYFMYANVISTNFGQNYQSIGLFQFIVSLF